MKYILETSNQAVVNSSNQLITSYYFLDTVIDRMEIAS